MPTKHAIIYLILGDDMADLTEQLLNKSKEAFILAIEIYNKPTIKYRVEGFAFFICNAWELMLKAYLIKTKGEANIYYKDNPERTISLENCIKQIFTNDKDPLRLNLEKIIELRNISTHFITEEYEMVYVPLFQSCIFNFNEKMQKFHGIDVTELISLNFLNLVVKEKSFDENEIRAKYSDQITHKLLGLNDKISKIVDESNSNFAVKIEHHYYITKDKNKATDTVVVDKNSTNPVQIIKELKNPNETHKYNAKKVCAEITKQIKRLNLNVKQNGTIIKVFNFYHFNLFCKYFGIKGNEKWCFVYKANSAPNYSYSMQAIEFIIGELKKDPENILDRLKELLATKNKLTPGAKEF